MQNKKFSFKDFIPYKFLYQVLTLALIVSFIYIAKSFYEKDIKEYKEHIYMQFAIDTNNKLDTYLHNKFDQLRLMGKSLSCNQNIKEALLERDRSQLDINSLLKKLDLSQYLKSDYLAIKDRNREIFQYHGDLEVLKNDTVFRTGFNASKIGVSFYDISPILHYGKNIGSVVFQSNFDTLVNMLREDGLDAVVILNKEDSKKIDIDHSRTKKFIDDYYVANKNSDPYLLKLIGQQGIGNYFKEWETPYNNRFSTEYLTIKYPVSIDDKLIANIIVFKKFIAIRTPFEQKILFQYIAYIIAVSLFFAFAVYALYVKNTMKRLDRDNKILNLENDDLREKSDQLDYNEKKLENLFNMQPNLMIMHNGYEITSANKRFMGFFNRFGDFDGFKSQHRCVSELFEKFDAPNYIWEQYIEGEFWIDYLLNNPKRLYKTVMSINGSPHHFIIKFNELTYAKYVSERLIIIALVDMTQDLPNYKSLEQLNQ